MNSVCISIRPMMPSPIQNLNVDILDLQCSERVAMYLHSQIIQFEAEEFWVMALNSMCQLLEGKMLFRGTVDQCFVHPRDVFRFALSKNASYLVIGHSHPSGHCEPSSEDIKMTKRLIQAGKMIQIPILDHVIVCAKNTDYFSFLTNRKYSLKNQFQ